MCATAGEMSTAMPKPLASALFLATAAVLSFRATARDRSGSTLGVLVDASGARQYLTVGANGAWALSSAKPTDQEAVLLYESAANVLRGGTLNADGSISYQGGSYMIESSFDQRSRTAKVRSSV